MEIKTIKITTDKDSILISDSINNQVELPLYHFNEEQLQNQVNLMTEVAKENNNEYLTIFHHEQSDRYAIIAFKEFLQLPKVK